MNDALSRLIDIGFRMAGKWDVGKDGIAVQLTEFGTARNVLYAFAADGELMYVGKTVQALRTRMNAYRNPGATQSTNIRNNASIRKSLENGAHVEIYVLPDNGLLHYGKFHVNLAAGLEDSVIRELNPPWNGGQKETTNQTLEPTED